MVRTLFAVQGDNFVDTIPDLWQVIQDEPSVYPETVTVRAGQQVSFMVTASAADASYEWQRNGNAIAGANSPMLTLSEVETDQSGSYTVKVSNGGGSATSGAVTLTVLPTVELNVGRYARLHVNGIAGRTYRLESTTTAGQAFSGGQEITLPAEGAVSLVEPLAKFSELFRVKLLP
jgi:plastocyanin